MGKSIGFIEGAKKQKYVNVYEKNTTAQDKCVEIL